MWPTSAQHLSEQTYTVIKLFNYTYNFKSQYNLLKPVHTARNILLLQRT